MNTTGRKHTFIEKHPALGAVLIGVFGLFGCQTVDLLVRTILHFLWDSEVMHIVSALLSAFIAYQFYKWWFRPEFKGFCGTERMKTGLIMALPVLLYWIIGVGATVINGTFVLNAPTVPMLSAVVSSSLMEELIFRGFLLSTLMREWKTEDKVRNAALIGAAVFGIMHALNVFAGADLMSTVGQVVTTFGKGIFYSAIFLCTGSVWATVICHFINNLTAGMTTTNTTGLVVTAADWTNILDAVMAFALGAYGLVQLKKRSGTVLHIWNKKWNRNPE